MQKNTEIQKIQITYPCEGIRVVLRIHVRVCVPVLLF